VGWDPAPHFKDPWGNDYVGLDMVDVENLAAVLWRLDDLINHPMVHGELVENVPAPELRDLTKGLEETLTYVDHLLGRTSSVKPADPSSPSHADP
jgi:hypothetical protein